MTFTLIHATEVKRVPYQQKFRAICACGWRQRGYCTTTDGAQRWAYQHERTTS